MSKAAPEARKPRRLGLKWTYFYCFCARLHRLNLPKSGYTQKSPTTTVVISSWSGGKAKSFGCRRRDKNVLFRSRLRAPRPPTGSAYFKHHSPSSKFLRVSINRSLAQSVLHRCCISRRGGSASNDVDYSSEVVSELHARCPFGGELSGLLLVSIPKVTNLSSSSSSPIYFSASSAVLGTMRRERGSVTILQRAEFSEPICFSFDSSCVNVCSLCLFRFFGK